MRRAAILALCAALLALSQRTILLKLDWRGAQRKKGARTNPAP